MILKAVKSKDASSVLKAISDGADVNEKSKRNGETALTLACEFVNLEIVKILLDAGANPNLKGELGYTPLMCAAASYDKAKDALEICQVLLKRGAEIELLNDDGETTLEVLLYAPGKNPNPAIAEVLILEMMRKVPNRDVSKAAFLVIEFGHVDTLGLLLKHGLDIESKDRFGYTLLHAACRKREQEKVDLLLKAGADFNFRPKLGWDDHPFALACRFGRQDWLELLRNAGLEFEQNQELLQTAINSAVEMGKRGILSYLESVGIVIFAKRGKLNSPIFTAIEYDRESFIKRYLSKGIDLAEKDSKGNTPIHHAAYYGRLSLLKAFAEAGGNLNALNKLGWNALMQAAASGKEEMAQYLILHGSNLDQRCSETGATALFIAATEGHLAIVEALLKAGANPGIQAKDGKIAATSAIAYGHAKVVSAFGNIQPHFFPHKSKNSEPICAFCAEVLTEEMTKHNYCPQCEAWYCDVHYPWGKWHVAHQTNAYDSRRADCPNGHVKWEG